MHDVLKLCIPITVIDTNTNFPTKCILYPPLLELNIYNVFFINFNTKQ